MPPHTPETRLTLADDESQPTPAPKQHRLEPQRPDLGDAPQPADAAVPPSPSATQHPLPVSSAQP
jgi:hypothetical protein